MIHLLTNSNQTTNENFFMKALQNNKNFLQKYAEFSFRTIANKNQITLHQNKQI
jgi:hypothetical protein